MAALTVFGYMSVAFAGGAATGGGSVCVNPAVNDGHPELLDLVLADQPELIDNPYTGTRLRETKVAEATFADIINLHNNRAYQYALARLQAWERRPDSKYSMALVEEGLKSIQFMITPLKIRPLSRVYLPEGAACQRSNLHTAILFDNGFLYISLPEWNSLGILSQAGLLIHESLRNVQILQQLDGTDADLERLTAKILMPYDGTTQMDAQPFFAKYISNGSSHAAADISKICSQMATTMAKYPALQNDIKTADVQTICSANLSLNGNIQSVEKSLGNLSNGIGRALKTKTFQSLGNNSFTSITTLAINMLVMADNLADVILRRSLYSGADASTVLNGATYSMYPNRNIVSPDSHFLRPIYLARTCARLKSAMSRLPIFKNYVAASAEQTICTTKFTDIKNMIAVSKSLNAAARGLVKAQTQLSPSDPNNDYVAKLVGKIEMAAFQTQNLAMSRALYEQTDAITGLRGVPHLFNEYLSACISANQFMSKYSNNTELNSVRADLRAACSASSPQDVATIKEANAVTKVAAALNGIVERSSLPFSPFTSKLTAMSETLALLGNNIGEVVIDNESYAVRDAITGMSGVFDSVATVMIRRYLHGEPLSYSPSVEARDERIVQEYIQVQRAENEQFLEGMN